MFDTKEEGNGRIATRLLFANFTLNKINNLYVLFLMSRIANHKPPSRQRWKLALCWEAMAWANR